MGQPRKGLCLLMGTRLHHDREVAEQGGPKAVFSIMVAQAGDLFLI